MKANAVHLHPFFKFSTLVTILFISTRTLAGEVENNVDQIWTTTSLSSHFENTKTRLNNNYIPTTKNARILNLNSKVLNRLLDTGQIELPLPNGSNTTFEIHTNHVMAPELASRFPEIKTYKVIDTKNKINYGHIDISPHGFHAMLYYNNKTIFIDQLQNGQYQSYYSADYAKEFAADFAEQKFTCGSPDHSHHSILNTNNIEPFFSNKKSSQKNLSFGNNIRTYRLAVAATGEYTEFHGGTKSSAMAAIVTAINRVNQVFERDFALSMQLVANNEDVVFIDGNTDPYTDGNSSAMIEENPPVLNDIIGFDNYDIGHVFGLAANGGVAYFYAPCSTRTNGKARAASSFVQPIGDRFFIGLVAHEFGHQLGAPHSFNGGTNSCSSGRDSNGAYEPGSGSTIMSYANNCGEENLQNSKDDFFHTSSIEFVRDFVDNLGGNNCGTISQNNNRPSVDAGIDGTIPKETPFLLTGSADDIDGDNLSYVWEQMDLGPQTNSRADFTDDGSRPLFRSFEPSTSSTRIFPQLSDVLNGTTTYGEILPSTDRSLTMRLTVRDGNGGVESDTRLLSVDSNSGPFTVISPTNATWEGESSQTVSWDVAGTNVAPVNCSNVEISLSTNGGQSFTHTLTSTTTNDGNAIIQVPNLNTTTGRVRIMCTNQPFFAINSSTITVVANAGTNIDPTANNDTFTVDQNSSNNTLNVLSNDSDADGDSLTISSVTDPSNGGSAVISGTSITYTPATNFSGEETFNYTIDDGNGGTASAQVTVSVTQENRPPIANDDTFTVTRNSGTVTIRVLDNDTDPDNDTLTITNTGTASNGGSVSTNLANTRIRYRPATDFFGEETFTYTISDGNGGSATATVRVSVENDNQSPVANDDNFTVEQDSGESIFNLVLNDDDPNNDSITISSITPSTNGSTIGIVLDDTHMSYQPASGFNGIELFTYTISDSNGGTDTAQVMVTVNASQPSNQAPIANDDNYTIEQGSAATTFDVLNNDSDADNDTLTITAVTGVSNGFSVSVSATSISYQAASSFSGTDTFNYTVSDGNGGTDTAQVTITVNATPPTTSPPTSGGGSSGGGSFGWLLLFLLGLRHVRQNLDTVIKN